MDKKIYLSCKLLVVLLISCSLSGCLTTMYVMKKLNEVEYTPTQISGMSNYGLVICKHSSNVKENSRNQCDEEIQSRLKNNKMSGNEYSQYEMQIEGYRQQQNAAASQQLHEQIMQNQAISAQQDAQMMGAAIPKAPIDVNVHHSY